MYKVTEKNLIYCKKEIASKESEYFLLLVVKNKTQT